jgi:NAD-dependent SIR2 family protein deacetylase
VVCFDTAVPPSPGDFHPRLYWFPFTGRVHRRFPFYTPFEITSGNIPAADAGVSSRALLIKLHGSLNWYYCETCQEVQRVNIKTMIDQYVADSSPYPVIGICKECGGQRRCLLVPPLAVKFDVPPPLTPLQKEAQDAFERAAVIAVVGYSFAEADTYISRMLSKSMQTNPQQRLIIVDPDVRVVLRVRRRFKAGIPGFDTTRVIGACTDCVEFMPRFLKGEPLSSRAPSAVAKRSKGRKSTKA